MEELFGHFFEKMSSQRDTEFKKTVNPQRKKIKNGLLYAVLFTLLIGAVLFYMWLPAINIFNQGFISFMIFILLIFVLLYVVMVGDTKVVKPILGIVAIAIVYLMVGNLISSPIFNADAYHKQIAMNKDANFYEDHKSISYDSIPVVDRDSAMRLGDRKMGEIVEYVSQFEVNASYQQINYNSQPYRVTPLEYSGLIKWFTNHKNGLPAYITVNMVNQDVEVVELEEGMKYSQSELFNRNITRHARFNYPTLMFDEYSFEINDDGIPYYIFPSYEYQIGIFGGRDITGAVLINAIDGSHEYFKVSDVPQWVDRVYPSSLISQQLVNWGKFGGGFINSMLSQKGVLQPTDGYNYIAMNGDVFYYTGLTSVSQDASNVGFAMINSRTKETKFYDISGAEEYSAMSSAEGQVQHLGYVATFPILVNAGGEPTYFMSLKDSANLVKQYAFVSVENYQIVATGDSVAQAEENYYKLLADNGKLDKDEVPTDTTSLTGKVTQLSSAVKDGNSTYYFKLDSSELLFIADISVSNELPLLSVGENVEIEFIEDDDKEEVISSIKKVNEE